MILRLIKLGILGIIAGGVIGWLFKEALARMGVPTVWHGGISKVAAFAMQIQQPTDKREAA